MMRSKNIGSFENVEINLQEFERLRERMIRTASLLGMNHPDVLKYSQKLDELHNKLLKRQMQEQR